MIKVALISTQLPERCGFATYADALIRHNKDPEIQYTIVGRPFDGLSLVDRCLASGADVVHMEHAWSLFGGFGVPHIKMLQGRGKKVICTFHESTSFNLSEFTAAFDKVVVHNDTTDGFKRIPHGIWDIPLPNGHGETMTIGTAGFPIGFKNDTIVAQVAARMGMKLIAFIPESQHANALTVRDNMRRLLPSADLITDFRSTEEIIRSLHKCDFTMFPHNQAGGGISGSVRFGLAAKRPCIVTETSRTADLKMYPDEVYFIPSGEPTTDQALIVATQVMEDIRLKRERLPRRVVTDMSWERVAGMHAQLYKEVLGVVQV